MSTDNNNNSNNEMSLPEKRICCELFSRKPKLAYPIKLVDTADGGKVRMYDIPKDVIHDVLADHWPFQEPAKQAMFDIHSNQVIDFDDCHIIRYKCRNILVCPDYTNTGGMVVDLVDIKYLSDDAKKVYGPLITQIVKKKEAENG